MLCPVYAMSTKMYLYQVHLKQIPFIYMQCLFLTNWFKEEIVYCSNNQEIITSNIVCTSIHPIITSQMDWEYQLTLFISMEFHTLIFNGTSIFYYMKMLYFISTILWNIEKILMWCNCKPCCDEHLCSHLKFLLYPILKSGKDGVLGIKILIMKIECFLSAPGIIITWLICIFYLGWMYPYYAAHSYLHSST